MTYSQHARSRRLLAEERVGARMRALQHAEIEAEDAQVEATKAAIRRTMPPPPVMSTNRSTPAVIQPRPITDEIVGV